MILYNSFYIILYMIIVFKMINIIDFKINLNPYKKKL